MLAKQLGWIWMNGDFIDWQEAKVHILTHTLHYGSGVFEGERAYNGRIFKMTEHHQRLHTSADILGFKVPYTVNELNSAAEEILRLNHLHDAYLRLFAWHGSEALNVSSSQNSVNVAIAAWKWKSYFVSKDIGLKLMWSDWVRPAPNMAPVHAKASGQYIIGTLGKNKAELNGYDDALMLDYRGYVAECSSANIFMVKDGIIYTPIADCFLNGITRKTIIELAQQHNITCIEKHILSDEIIEADEIFITGSAAEVQPIIKLGNKDFSIGKITEYMIKEYQKLVTGKND
jgi:branched-chain amino acid aminotransferase group I